MGALSIIKANLCDRCLQYAEDCECCTDCGCVDLHEHGCGEVETTRHPRARFESAIVPRKYPTLRGLGVEDEQTIETPVVVIRVSEAATGLDATCEIIAFRPSTMRMHRR